MDIEGMDEKLAQELVRADLVSRIDHLYTLHERKDELRAMARMGAKRAQNLFDAIERSKSQPLPRLVFGLGITGVGPEIAQSLSREFRRLSAVLEATEEQLKSVNGIGPRLAKSIQNWSASNEIRQLVNRLGQLGLTIEDDSPEPEADHPIKGLTFVITGKLHGFSRTEAANAVKALGGKASGSVSKNTDFLVAGANAGSKLEHAIKLKVPVLDEDQFKEVLGGKLPDLDELAETPESSTATLL